MMNVTCFTLLFTHHRLSSRAVDNEHRNVVDQTCQTLFHVFRMRGVDDHNGAWWWRDVEGLLVQGFAIPFLAISASVYLVQRNSQVYVFHFQNGDPNVHLWTMIFVLLPCLLITFWPQTQDTFRHQKERFGVTEWQSRLSLFAAVTGDSAVAALSLFLVPVAKHSPLIQIFGLSFTQALVFHKVAGWISLVFTMLHGGLYLMDYATGIFDGKEDPHLAYGFRRMIHRVVPPARCWTLEALGYRSTGWGSMNTSALVNSTITGNSQHWLMDKHAQEQLLGHHGCNLFYFNFSGVVSMLSFVVLAVFSLPCIRRRAYWLFYTVHIPMAWLMMVGAIIHITYISLFLVPNIIYYLAPTVSVWIQQFLNSRRNGGVLLKSVTKISDSNGCCLLRLHKSPSESGGHEENSAFALGAVCKLCIPEISSIWHPFSTMKDPKTKDYVFLIRPTGTFTKDLLNRLTKDWTDQNEGEEEGVNTALLGSGVQFRPPLVLVDGIYPAEYRWHARSLHHDSVLLIAGGVGIVPFLPLLSELYQSVTREGCCLRRIALHWFCREEGLARFICKEFLPWYLNGATTQLEEKSDERVGGAEHEVEQRSEDLQKAKTIFDFFIHITSRPGGDRVDFDTTSSFINPETSLDYEISNSRNVTVELIARTGVAMEKAYVATTNNQGQNNMRFLWIGSLFAACAAMSWFYYGFETHINRGHSLLIRMHVVLLCLFCSVLAVHQRLSWGVLRLIRFHSGQQRLYPGANRSR